MWSCAGNTQTLLIRNIIFGGIMLALMAGLWACQTSETSYGDSDPCTTNDDCKRNRVCVDGLCVYPGSLDGDTDVADGDVTENDSAGADADEGPDQGLICDSLCGWLNDCDLLNSSSPFGSSFEGCHTWCVSRAFATAAVACVKSQACDMTASARCLGIGGDEDEDIVDIAEESEPEQEEETEACTYQGTVQAGSSESGSTAEAANDLWDASACGEYSFMGNDHIWKLIVAAGSTVKVSLVGNGFDPALWILDSCGGSCIAASDTEGSTETLMVNATDTDLTLVVVVDATGEGVGGQYLLGVSEVSQDR